MKGIKELCIPYCNMHNFLELQCLVDDLGKVDVGLQNEKSILLHKHLYCFFLKTVTDDLN